MNMVTVLLTKDEINALMVAVAKSIDPDCDAKDAHEASAVVWAHADIVGQPLCSLSTMFAEAAY